jgi:NADH:ubiquinone reductase (non-electrogenic)
MKGKGILSALQAASRAFSAPRPLQTPTQLLGQSFYSHAVLVRANGLFDQPFTRAVARASSPFVHNEHLFQRCAGFSTAAERICDKDEGDDASEKAVTEYVGLPATKQSQKPRVVVLGTGWGACRLLKELDTRIYDIVCISPRNHMVFTPLLASTCVGTLEFCSVAEPVRIIQPALAKEPDSYFFLAWCTDIDTSNHEVYCESIYDEATGTAGGDMFRVAYDKLVVATGVEATTFGIDGVYEHAIFLRDVKNAMDIHSKLMLNLMRCEIPGIDLEERKRLLHYVVVGGGPTGVEFSGELNDFIQHDVQRKFSHVKDLIAVTLIEASEILSSFDVRLRQYATNQLTKSKVKLKRGVVKHVLPKKIILTDGSEVPYGLLVWSTGVGPSSFVKELNQFEKSKGGRIGVDDNLRVPAYEDIYAIGDCAGYLEGTGKTPLPALAQVAERQGKYLAKSLNKLGESGHARAGSGTPPVLDPFVYKHLGSMATVGRYKALVDLRESPEKGGVSMTGFKSWLVWRSAYLTRVISWRARMYVAFNWATTFVFGRDISRF